MKDLASVLALALLSLRAVAVQASPAAWEKIDVRDGVEVYAIPPDDAGVVSFKGVATLDAPVSMVAAAMRDNDTAARWMPMVGERTTLRDLSQAHGIEYTHMKMPWPATDRYFVSSSSVSELSGGGVLFVVASVDEKQLEPGWERPDMILATFHHSEFRLRPSAEGRTEIDFEVRSSAGGVLPTWLVSMGQKNWPRDFVVGLRGELERRKAAR